MKKLMIAVAGAVALTGSVFADTVNWFNGGVAEKFPKDATMFGGAWSNATEQAAWDADANAVVFDADAETPLAFNATEAKALAGAVTNVTVEATVKFTPFAYDSKPEVPEGAKAAVILTKQVVDEVTTWRYCFYNGTATWGEYVIEGTFDPDQSASVKVVCDGASGSLQYFVDDALIGTGTSMAGVSISAANFAGDGELASLTATYAESVVEFTVASIANADVIAVSNNNVALTAPYKAIPGSEVIVTYKAKEGYLFSDGSETKQGTGTVAAGEIGTDVKASDIQEGAVKIGTKYYLTLQNAVDAAAGATVELCKDITLTARVDINNDVTIDLAGKTIYPTATCGNHSAFNVVAGTTTITNGTIDATAIDESAGETDAITIRAGATVNLTADLAINIKTKDGACVYAFDGGYANIYGGTYDNQTLDDYTWVKGIKGMPLNQANVATQLIKVYGGSFRQYNPANGDDAGLCTTFLADGYYSAKSGDYWVVIDEEPAVKIGTTYYLTLQDAAKGVQEGETIELLADIATADQLAFVEKDNVTFDLGGNTVTTTFGGHSLAVFGGSVTITNGVWNKTADSTVTIVGKLADDASYKEGSPYYNIAYQGVLNVAADTTIQGHTGANVIKINNGATVNVVGGTLTSTGADKQCPIKCADSTANISAGTVDGTMSTSGSGVINVTGGTFTVDPSDYVQEGYTAVKSGEVWVVEKDTPSPGPVTPPTGGGSVTPAEGESGVYIAEPDVSSMKVTITGGLQESDVIRVTNAVDMTIVGVPANQIQIKIGGKVIPNGAFVGGNESDGFSTELTSDPEATVTIDGETIKVVPQVGETATVKVDGEDVPAFAPAGDATAVAIQAIPGLTYTLKGGKEPSKTLPTPCDSKTAGGSKENGFGIKLENNGHVTGESAFFVIEVRK